MLDLELYERRIDTLTAETQSQFVEAFAYDSAYIPTESKDLNESLAIGRRFIGMYRASSLIKAFEKYDLSAQKGSDPDDFAHAHIHAQDYLPGTFLASALRKLSRNDDKAKAKIINALYPSPGEYDESSGYPPFEMLLALAGISNQQGLNKLFEEEANQIFSGNKPTQKVSARLRLGRTEDFNQFSPTL